MSVLSSLPFKWASNNVANEDFSISSFSKCGVHSHICCSASIIGAVSVLHLNAIHFTEGERDETVVSVSDLNVHQCYQLYQSLSVGEMVI